MRKLAILLIFLSLLGLTLFPVQAGKDQTWIQNESIGSYICSCKPDANKPEKDFYQGSWNKCSERFLIRFDLSGLPKGVQITGAKLSLYCMAFVGDDSGNKDLVYGKITEPWDENKVTFANQPKTSSEDSASTGWPFDQKWQDVDITQIVRQWVDGSAPNYGILGYGINEKGTCYASFTSSDSSLARFRPKLTISYK